MRLNDFMRDAARFEDTDRYASSAIVTAISAGTKFYLNDDGYATDIKERARVFRSFDEASIEARKENAGKAWQSTFGPWSAHYLIEEDI